MRSVSRGLPRDRAYAVLDQAVFSLTSLVVTVLVAQRLGATDFGYFALEYAGYWLALGSLRALIGEPTLIFSGKVTPVHERFRYEGGPAAAVVLSAAVAVVPLVVGLSLGLWSLVALSLVFPLVALQDCLRYVLLSLRRGGSALVGDVAGLMVIVLAGLLLRPGSVAVWWLVVGAGGLAGLVVQLPRVQISFSTTAGFLRETGSIGTRAFIEFVVTSGVGQLVIFLMPAVASVSDVAGLRAAQTLASPLNVLMTAAGLVTLGPLSARVASGGPQLGLMFARRISLVLIGAAIACAALVALVPSEIWTGLFGASWGFVGMSGPLLCLQQGAGAAGLFATYFLRVSGRAGTSVRLRVAVAPLVVVCALAGAYVSGAEGASFGLFLSMTVVAAAYWTAAYRVGNRRESSESLRKAKLNERPST